MKREFSAGGLVYKKIQVPSPKIQTNFNGQDTNLKQEALWLIRRPTANPEYRGNLGWSFPKGWIDSGEKPEEAAIREVGEEGGVVAGIVEKLETIKIFFTDQQCEKVMKFITYYLMEYEADKPEGHDGETEEVRWVSFEEGIEMLAFNNDKRLLKKAYEKV